MKGATLASSLGEIAGSKPGGKTARYSPAGNIGAALASMTSSGPPTLKIAKSLNAGFPTPATRDERDELDRYMEDHAGDRDTIAGLVNRSNLGQDTVVYRGHYHPDPSLSGEGRFVAASVDPQTASDFGPIVSTIHVDKDAPALRTEDYTRKGMNEEEQEILLGEGKWSPTGAPNTYRFSAHDIGAGSTP